MTKTIAQHGAFVICHGALAPVIERSEVMRHLRPAGRRGGDKPGGQANAGSR